VVINLNRVVLPAPSGPMRPKSVLGLTVSVISLIALTGPKALLTVWMEIIGLGFEVVLLSGVEA
jgi:hypothetical protein